MLVHRGSVEKSSTWVSSATYYITYRQTKLNYQQVEQQEGCPLTNAIQEGVVDVGEVGKVASHDAIESTEGYDDE
jgi:hypothetical protein